MIGSKYYLLGILMLALSAGESLFSVYLAAGPAEGYDKYLILDPELLYTGGIGVFEGSVFIEGNGAVIDLQDGSGIWVYGEGETVGSLDIQRCTIQNGGAYGVNFAGIATGSLVNCNLVNDGMGLQLMDTVSVSITNCNLVDNEIYGLAIYSTNPTADISYCNAWNNGEDYMENCPG